MTLLEIILLASALIFLLGACIATRAQKVMDFRAEWRSALTDDPDALNLFHKQIPSFNRMLWSFKRLKDSNWIPADVRYAKHRSQMDSDTRKKLDKWIKDGGRV